MSKRNARFEVRKCINPECGLRYSIPTGLSEGYHCPHCRSDTIVLLADLSAQEVPEAPAGFTDFHLEVMLDGVRSAWNVGAIFRAADGAGVARIHLCGICPTPANAGVIKTSLGAEKAVAWQYHPDAVATAADFSREGYHIWALEGGPRTEPLADVLNHVESPLLLVVGNEVSGVDPGIIEMAERVVFLSMSGIKKSLNVAIAFGIAIYSLRARRLS